MSGNALPQAAWRAARLRAIALLAAFALPWLAALAALALRLGGRTSALVVAAAGLLLIAFIAVLRWRRRDLRWLLRALNARADMEDSADLLAAAPPTGTLQQLQRQRLQQRLAAHPADLRTAWPWPRARRWWPCLDRRTRPCADLGRARPCAGRAPTKSSKSWIRA